VSELVIVTQVKETFTIFHRNKSVVLHLRTDIR